MKTCYCSSLKTLLPPIIIGPQVYRKFEVVRSARAVQVNDVMRNTTVRVRTGLLILVLGLPAAGDSTVCTTRVNLNM